MPHDYNTRTIANLETKLLDGFSSFKDEFINLKDVVIRNLKEENAKLRSSVKVLENKFNHLEQYGIHNNIKVSRTPDLIGENELERSVIKIMKTIDVEVDDLVVKALDSQSRDPVFKTTGWLQGRLSLSSF